MAHAVREREVSAVELVEAHAARIEERNPDVNAIVVLRLDEARVEARAADAALARGERPARCTASRSPPRTVIEVDGLRATNGSTLFAGRVATHDCAS